jgi:hypothetical protein
MSPFNRPPGCECNGLITIGNLCSCVVFSLHEAAEEYGLSDTRNPSQGRKCTSMRRGWDYQQLKSSVARGTARIMRWCAVEHRVIDCRIGEFEVFIMIDGVPEEMHGSDRVPDLGKSRLSVTGIVLSVSTLVEPEQRFFRVLRGHRHNRIG